MSFLFKKVAAQDLSGNVIVVKHGNIWNIESPNEPHRKLIGSNFLSRAEAEKTAKEVGYSISGVYEDSRKNGIAEYVKAQDGNSEFIIEHSRIPIAQLGGEENAKKSGYIVAKKNGRTYGVHIDGYSDELTRRTLKDAGYAFDGCEGKDSADFKVGDKVVVRSGGYGKIVAIKPNGMYKIEGGGMEGSFPASELVKVADSAAMDARSDVRMHLHEAEDHIVGVVNSFTNYAVDKTAKEIAAIDELKGVIRIIHKVASVF